MAIIAISGKINSGKDTIANIIKQLDDMAYPSISTITTHSWKVVKFADALKDIVCILTGCTREQLEDIDFKNSKLSNEWIRYGYADGFIKKYIGDGTMGEPIMNNKQCSKEKYEEELRTNWQTAYKDHLTYRQLLQYLGTDLLRNQLHENVWVNALMNKYKPAICSGTTHCALAGKPEISCNQCPEYPNWIITDVRFPNEANAIKERGGINIKVNRDICKHCGEFENLHINYDMTKHDYTNHIESILCNECHQFTDYSRHPSETSLDDYTFDYVIYNNDTIEELIHKVKEILIKEHII